jgi:hypothetical protein
MMIHERITRQGHAAEGLQRRLRVLLVPLALTLIFVASCGGKKEVKQVSQESKLAQEAFSLAEKLRVAYEKRNFSAVQDLSTDDGFRDFTNSIRHFDSVDLSFTPRWVEIEKTTVYLNVSWKGTWTVGQESFTERGMGVFLLEGAPLKLGKIVRGNPFKYPER